MKHRNYKDAYGYMLETSRSWGMDDGRGDSVARTVLAAIIYRDEDFNEAIRMNFAPFLKGEEWNILRISPPTLSFITFQHYSDMHP